jgi:tRNA U34 5-methylaminomethyl-2-thiouridine-forming methyltransferase MnmC
MATEIIVTKDGSHSIAIPEMNVTYHSHHGAIQESMHVFIQAGLEYVVQQATLSPVRIFEMGLGTGLNALLAMQYAQQHQLPVQYEAVELHPLAPEFIQQLNYSQQTGSRLTAEFLALHQSPWQQAIEIAPCFTFTKHRLSLHDFVWEQPFHLVFYDAFAPAAQPDLWTEAVFTKIYNGLLPGGVLVTYCSKGDVRRALQAAGFMIEKIPGPPGKREMIRARKKE